jgi:P2-related tail formation protein
MARFADIPHYLLDDYFEETHEGVTVEGYTVDETAFYQDVKFTDTDATSTNWEWIDLNDWSWTRWYILSKQGWSDNSQLIGDRHGIVGRGGYWTKLFVDIDGTLTEVNFRSDVDEWVDGSYFVFTIDPSASAVFESGSDTYFRKDSYIHEWMTRLAETDDIFKHYFNLQKPFAYFGKIYLYDSATGEYRVHWQGMRDFAYNALPDGSRTEKMQEFLNIYFDRIHNEIYGMLKNLITLIDPHEVDIDFLGYISQIYDVTITEDISGSAWALTEEQQRDFVSRIISWLKRKGTYAALYIIWKLIIGLTPNRLNIYEMWHDGATPGPPSFPQFVDYLYTSYYDVDAGNNLVNNFNMEIDDYWYDHNSPDFNVRSGIHSYSKGFSRFFRSETGGDGIKSYPFTTETNLSYKCSAWVWPTDSTVARIHLTPGSGVGVAHSQIVSGLTLNTWNKIESDGNQSTGGTATRVVVSSPSGGTFFVDNVRAHEYTGAGKFYYESKGVSAYPLEYDGYGDAWTLAPHYKVEIDMSNAPFGDDFIMDEPTIFNLLKYWEIIRPVTRVPHYRTLIAPLADFSNLWKALYAGAYPAVYNTVLLPTVAAPATGTDFYIQVATSDEWLITHSLSTLNVLVQCYDGNSERLIPENIQSTGASDITVETGAPDSGTVYMATADESTANGAATTWNINHGNGDQDVFSYFVDTSDNQIIPDSITNVDANNLTATFSTAVDGNCYTRAKQIKIEQTAASVSWSIVHNLEVIGVMVECFNSSDEKIYPEVVKLVSSNLATASFAVPQSGYALVIGVGAPNTQGSVWTPLTSGYIELGTGSDTATWNPWLNESLKNTVITIPNEHIEYVSTSTYYYVTFDLPLSSFEGNITEVGLFNGPQELIFYSYCDPIYKSSDVGLTMHYRIER